MAKWMSYPMETGFICIAPSSSVIFHRTKMPLLKNPTEKVVCATLAGHLVGKGLGSEWAVNRGRRGIGRGTSGCRPSPLNFPFFGGSFHVQETERRRRRSHVHLTYLAPRERGRGRAWAWAGGRLQRRPHPNCVDIANYQQFVTNRPSYSMWDIQ